MKILFIVFNCYSDESVGSKNWRIDISNSFIYDTGRLVLEGKITQFKVKNQNLRSQVTLRSYDILTSKLFQVANFGARKVKQNTYIILGHQVKIAHYSPNQTTWPGITVSVFLSDRKLLRYDIKIASLEFYCMLSIVMEMELVLRWLTYTGYMIYNKVITVLVLSFSCTLSRWKEQQITIKSYYEEYYGQG